MSEDFSPATPVEVQEVRNLYGIGDNVYLLMLASREPRKNHAGVLSAWKKVVEKRDDVWLVIAGGLMRNELIMQIYADVTRRPLSLIRSAQGPALGSAIHAAVAAGAYPDVPAAAAAMGSMHSAVYTPVPASAVANCVIGSTEVGPGLILPAS